MLPPKATFSTFAHDEDTLNCAINCGAELIILEHPNLSARTRSDSHDPDFSQLIKLIKTARTKHKTQRLAINIDILPQESSLETIEDCLTLLQSQSINEIRIQDPGLIYLIRKKLPNLNHHLSAETGNMNALSVKAYSDLFHSQTLPMELPYADIKALDHVNTTLEIQVHGPICIQYSPRRFLKGVFEGTGSKIEAYSVIEKNSVDQEYPGRVFPFLDNRHGHFMFLNFDRCLLKSLPDVINLGLQQWLIDCRSYTIDTMEKVLKRYRDAQNRFYDNPSAYQSHDAGFEALQQACPRPLKPGFFKANKTDQDRDTIQTTLGSRSAVATVIDIIKERCITIRLHHPLSHNDKLRLLTPNGKRIPISASSMRALDQRPINTAEKDEIITLRWEKGIIPGSIIEKAT